MFFEKNSIYLTFFPFSAILKINQKRRFKTIFKFFNPGKIKDDLILRVSISLKIPDGWVFVKDQATKSFDLICGLRMRHETATQAGARILKEKYDLEADSIQSICPYAEDSTGEVSYGMLLFAKINGKDTCSSPSLEFFDKIPDKLTGGEVTRRLFTGTQGWLNMQTNADELWDVYDENRNLTGRLHRRGDFLEEGDYHLVVHVWLLNSKGEFLLTKRAPNKGFPNAWETSGGAAQAGDDSLSAALREVREETGLIALPENAERIFAFKREEDFCDVWLIRQDFDLKDVVLLPGETIDKQYASRERILEMHQNKTLVPYSYLSDFFSMVF